MSPLAGRDSLKFNLFCPLDMYGSDRVKIREMCGKEKKPEPKLKIPRRQLLGVTEEKKLVKPKSRSYRTQDLPKTKPTLWELSYGRSVTEGAGGRGIW